MRIRYWFVVMVAAAVAAVQSPLVLTQGPMSDVYVIADLGTLGGAQSGAFAINELGQVAGSAGRSDGTTHAFFFDDVPLRDLGTIGGADSAAAGVNRHGQVVGRSLSVVGNTKGFSFSAGVRRSLGTLGGSHSAAYAVNDAGDVVGSATTAGNVATRAFLYRGGALRSLGTLGGTNSVATAINQQGEITGSASTPGNTATHAFLFRDGAMTDIGTLGTSSEALGINTSAEVVGRSTLASGASRAFLYSGGTMVDLGTLGGRNSEAAAINDYSEVVGASEVVSETGTHAFLYRNGAMTDLNTRLPPGSGWVLESATALSPWGEIAGVGTIDGQRHAFRLSRQVTLDVFLRGLISDGDSNLPHDGVQVGRAIMFLTSVRVHDDAANALNVRLVDIMEGPIEILSARSHYGDPCAVSGRVVTCHTSAVGPGASFEEEVTIMVTVTGPGAFSHRAHATADNAVTHPSTDTASESNIGIALKSFTLSATTVAGGKAVSARAELTNLPSPGGSVVHLESSDSTIAPVPSPFVVQRPTAVRTFNIVPPVVSQPTPVTITATYGRVAISQTLTVLPPAIGALSLTRSTMIGSCQTATAKVTLTGSAPATGARVTLSATATGIHLPSTITVAPGDSSASLTVTAEAVHTLSAGLFTASFGGVTKQLPLAVRPIYLTAVTLSPSAVTGGSNASGAAMIECPAPAGGMTASITSTNPSVAVPSAASLLFAAGSTTAAFSVGTNPVAALTTPAIRVVVNGVTKSASLALRP